jgi:hypothetical protein
MVNYFRQMVHLSEFWFSPLFFFFFCEFSLAIWRLFLVHRSTWWHFTGRKSNFAQMVGANLTLKKCQIIKNCSHNVPHRLFSTIRYHNGLKKGIFKLQRWNRKNKNYRGEKKTRSNGKDKCAISINPLVYFANFATTF